QERKEVGFIAISAGEGLSQIFKNLGVDEIIEGGQTMNPSTEDILNAIEKVNADAIFLLPNNKNIILAAEQAAKLTEDKKILVVPSRSVPEGIHAIFQYEEGIPHETMLETMIESLKEVKTPSVTYAVRDTSLDGKEIKEGDILGMVGDNIAVVSQSVEEGTRALIDQIVSDDSEMISLYFGADVTQEQADEMLSYVTEQYPDCEAEIQWGKQPLYYYIISVE
ncbi:MAG: DAK2 domain-containing protein, partial [Epulopiscium sp.]|nr:DAK2 domain-containing protein [Candidatus Epulonipiscium sp.]